MFGVVAASRVVDPVKPFFVASVSPCQLQGFGSRHLHSVSQLERLDAGGEGGFAGVSLKLVTVETIAQKVELVSLLANSDMASGAVRGCQWAVP